MLLTLFSKYCIPISSELVIEAHDTALRIAGEGGQGLRKLSRPEVGVEVLRALAMGREE
jgi:exosome complex component RRP4